MQTCIIILKHQLVCVMIFPSPFLLRIVVKFSVNHSVEMEGGEIAESGQDQETTPEVKKSYSVYYRNQHLGHKYYSNFKYLLETLF